MNLLFECDSDLYFIGGVGGFKYDRSSFILKPIIDSIGVETTAALRQKKVISSMYIYSFKLGSSDSFLFYRSNIDPILKKTRKA